MRASQCDRRRIPSSFGHSRADATETCRDQLRRSHIGAHCATSLPPADPRQTGSLMRNATAAPPDRDVRPAWRARLARMISARARPRSDRAGSAVYRGAGARLGASRSATWFGSVVQVTLSFHSALMPANLTTLPHLSVSSAMSLPNSAGELANDCRRPGRQAVPLILGSARPALISLLSLSTISAGVFLGAPMPNQVLAS